MKRFYPAAKVKAILKSFNLLFSCNLLLFVLVMLLITPDANAGTISNHPKHKLSKTRRLKASVINSPPTLSYPGPHTYNVSQPITPLQPVSSNVTTYAYETNEFEIPSAFFGGDAYDAICDAAGNLFVSGTAEVDEVAVDGTVTTIASGFNAVSELVLDPSGNIYVSDNGANLVYKIAARTHTKTTVGSGFSGPAGITLDAAGNIYVSELNVGDIKKIQAGTNTTTVFATGLSFPLGMAFDKAGNFYVCDSGNSAIKEIRFDGGGPVSYTLPGGEEPLHMRIDGSGRMIITTDVTSYHFAEVYGVAAGDTPANAKVLFTPEEFGLYGVAADASGDIFIAVYDPGSFATEIYKLIPQGGYFLNRNLPLGLQFDCATGIISGAPLVVSPATAYTITAWNGNPGTTDTSKSVTATVTIGTAVVSAPVVSYASPLSYPINAAIPGTAPTSTGGSIHGLIYHPSATYAGSGFNKPSGVTVDAVGNIYVADRGNNAVKKISGSTITTIGSGFSKPTDVAIDAAGDIFIADYGNNAVKKIPAGSNTPVAWGSGFSNPISVAVDAAGNVYVADKGNNAVKKISPNGTTTTAIGSNLNAPSGVICDAAGNVYVADTGTGSIKVIGANGGSTQLVSFGFNNPFDLAMDAQGDLYVANEGDNTIDRVDRNTGVVLDILGAEFSAPEGIAVDNAGYVYIADAGNNALREIQPFDGYFINKPLPTGMKFDGNTGIISGTPTVLTPASNYTVTAYNSGGNTSTTFSVKVTTSDYLSSLTSSAGSLSPAFAGSTFAYTANVPNTTTTSTVTPTVVDPAATIKVNGTTLASGSASAAIPLVVGPNVISVTVTASDGVTTQTYTVTTTRAPSAVASLAGLTLSQGTLSPAFAAATASYTATVTNPTASITLTPTTTDNTATVKVNGTTVASGSASGAIALNIGQNTVTTVVTAQDGTTTKTYTVVVTRPSNNALLTKISTTPSTSLVTISGPGHRNYSTTVPHSTTSIQVTAITQDATATIKVNGNTVASGVLSPVIPLVDGDNDIHTVVTAQDGVTIKDYIITVTRGLSNNSNLGNLVISAGTLTPVFSTSTTSYTVAETNSVSSITVTPTVADGASVKVNGVAVTSGTASGAIALAVGSNAITIALTSEDGSTNKTYTINATRSATGGGSSDALLSKIATNSGVALTQVTGSDYRDYTLSLPNTTSTITVTPTVQDATATVKVNGVTVASGTASASIPLAIGNTVINTIVTAQDGVTIKTYDITVTRAPGGSTNAVLSKIATNTGVALTQVTGSDYRDYTISVPNATSTVQVTATAQDATATIKINGVTVASGTPSANIPLAVGNTVINTVVTAQDGVTVKTYGITITRAAGLSNNALLSKIATNSGVALTQVTGTDYRDYTISVPNSTSTITVTPTLQDATATVKVNGVTVASGIASASIPLQVGNTVINTVVTAQDGVTTKTYDITVTRAAMMTLYVPKDSTTADGLTVHQGVTPNGDGINDIFNIDGISAYPDNKVTIMSRSGAVIFEATGYDNQTKFFDGHSSKNGSLQLPGTYFYSLEYTSDGKTKFKTGFIVLKY